MSKVNWQDLISEEYGDGAIEETTQNVVSEIDSEGKANISFGDETFYVKLPPTFASDLPLLSDGANTPEESYRLTELLRVLKSRDEVKSDDGRYARAEFMMALCKREEQLASQLRQRLAE